MKKKIFIIIPIILVLIVLIYLTINFIQPDNKDNKFYLDDKYYNENTSNSFKEIELSDFEKMSNNKETFALFVYQPLCETSAGLEEIVKKFQSEYQIQFYAIAFSKIKDSPKCSYLKYYPSFIIIKDGEMVDYLDANDNDDIKYYKSYDSFTKWFTTYVKLKSKRNVNSTSNTSNSNTPSNSNSNIEKITLKNVKKSKNKVNIYFFWGNGCSHCKEEKEFFNSIEKEYGKYYNLYMFETWFNEENEKNMHLFASAMGDTIKGVPYTIIGHETYKGFSSEKGNDMKKAIKKQYKKSYDVYFDKLKE